MVASHSSSGAQRAAQLTQLGQLYIQLGQLDKAKGTLLEAIKIYSTLDTATNRFVASQYKLALADLALVTEKSKNQGRERMKSPD